MEHYKKEIIAKNVADKLRSLEKTGLLAIKVIDGHNGTFIIEIQSLLITTIQERHEQLFNDFKLIIKEHFKDVLIKESKRYYDLIMYKIDFDKAEESFNDKEKEKVQETFDNDCKKIKDIVEDRLFCTNVEYRNNYLIVHTRLSEDRLTDLIYYHEALLNIISKFPKFSFVSCTQEEFKEPHWTNKYYTFNYFYEK